MLSMCVCTCFGSLNEADDAADGFLTEGEYDGSYVTPEGTEELYVMGGGWKDWSKR